MKVFKHLAWSLAVVFILASCNTALVTPTAEQSEEGLEFGSRVVRPDMKEGGLEGSLQAQAETYTVKLRFVGNPPTSVRDALNAAKAKWESAITQGVSDINITVPANQCGNNPAFSGVVDDILIFGGVANIDGPGGILAQSGPCYIRTSNKLPIVGTLIFDSADISAFSSQLTPIAIHEIGHSLGIGTIWSLKGLLSGAGTSNPRFTGAAAKQQWLALGGSGNVPVENTGGSGTRDSHWRESVFGKELMTGFLNSGTNPLSRMSIASLRDLGYVVRLTAADPYQLP